jgi:hypothetical protein
MKLRIVIIAAASLASVLSLTTSQAEARARVYITGYAANPYYTEGFAQLKGRDSLN